MPVSRRRKPKEREATAPSKWKSAMKVAMVKRLAVEREAIAAHQMAKGSYAAYPQRFGETEALAILKDVPSVFAFAEQEGVGYMRPQWASSRWGSK